MSAATKASRLAFPLTTNLALRRLLGAMEGMEVELTLVASTSAGASELTSAAALTSAAPSELTSAADSTSDAPLELTSAADSTSDAPSELELTPGAGASAIRRRLCCLCCLDDVEEEIMVEVDPV